MAATTGSLRLDLLPDVLAVARLEPTDGPPDWAWGGGFVAVVRTSGELSIVCEAARVPAGVRVEGPFRALGVAGPLAFDAVGVLAALTVPLAAEGLPILAIATFDTDYLLVRAEHLPRVADALRRAGHRVEGA